MKTYRKVKKRRPGEGGPKDIRNAERPVENCGKGDQKSLISLRPYQRAVFENKRDGIQVLLWGRQTGKSFTLAAWAVDRLVTRPGRLVTILSNSKTNGIELNRRCAEVCAALGHAFEYADLSTDQRFESLNTETRITIDGKVGRIKVLAANPRTARGFSGDLILDEFAFHENAAAIWEAAEPILASNADFLCRIASTPNGKHNMFYRLATDANIPLSRVTRTEAYAQGCPVFHQNTREPITPEKARSLASNKRVYDQNYECVFEDENMALLTHELITTAERPEVGFVCEQNWSEAALALLAACEWELYAGVDVGRNRHWTVVTVVEKRGSSYLARAILRIEGTRLPEQQQRLEQVLGLSKLRAMKMDMTGIGLGLYEYTREKYPGKVLGVNFGASVPALMNGGLDGAKQPTIRMTEHLATRLLQTYEDRAIQQPIDSILRDDLRKPERMVGPNGRVSIAATAEGAGHADHFWSLALAIDAAKSQENAPTFVQVIQRWKRPLFETRRRGLTM